MESVPSASLTESSSSVTLIHRDLRLQAAGFRCSFCARWKTRKANAEVCSQPTERRNNKSKAWMVRSVTPKTKRVAVSISSVENERSHLCLQ
jgi:hypothetical protein